MIPLRASRYGGQDRGFSLLELLIATAISALITAAIVAIVPAWQAFFEQTPAVIDMQQRGRTAIDVIAQAVRNADRLLLIEPDPSQAAFRQLMTIGPKAHAAQGVVGEDQGPGGDLLLSDAACPAVADVCGFVRGATAVIADDNGRFDLFVVGGVDLGGRSISPRRPFDLPYGADATVVEVDAYTFRLEPQPDGSNSLVRETGAGAVQPIVDRVGDLRFQQTVGLRGIDITLRLQPPGAPPVMNTRRLAVTARNLP